MTTKPIYRDRVRVKAACDAILKIIQPGDVVNQVGDFRWWEFWLAIGSRAIQSHQKNLFGKNADWKDDHTMLYFDQDNTFSVELPRATLKPLQEYCLSNLSIYRLCLKKLTPADIKVMIQAAREMVGTDYDLGQLLDIAINDILGFQHQRRLTIFDFGRKKKVCSVGVRVVFEHLYRTKIRPPDAPEKWLFDQLNPEKWSEKAIQKFRGTDVEATTPAHFANSDYFQHEFKRIDRFRNGVQVYPK